MWVATMASQSSWRRSSNGETAIVPALETSTSSRPNRSTAVSVSSRRSSRRVTSTRTPVAVPPRAVMRSTTAFSRSSRRAPRTSRAPRSARWAAVASPMPLLAPVIATTLPRIPDMAGLPFLGVRRWWADVE